MVELSNKLDIFIYNKESSGQLHNALCKANNYICSEYLGPEYERGQIVNSIRNEDLQHLSFNDDSFDIIISADVFEHIPNPYKAHEEIFRVLNIGDFPMGRGPKKYFWTSMAETAA